jgi:lysophospholipase L1-like esterase
MHYVDVTGAMLDRNGQPRPELFGPDSLHMNGAGYAEWTRVIRAALLEREARLEQAGSGSARQK